MFIQLVHLILPLLTFPLLFFSITSAVYSPQLRSVESDGGFLGWTVPSGRSDLSFSQHSFDFSGFLFPVLR